MEELKVDMNIRGSKRVKYIHFYYFTLVKVKKCFTVYCHYYVPFYTDFGTKRRKSFHLKDKIWLE